MPHTLPILALVAVVALAGCLGGFDLGVSSDDPTTTTETPTTTGLPRILSGTAPM